MTETTMTLPVTPSPKLTRLAEAYRDQRRNSREIAKLYHDLRADESMSLPEINRWLRDKAKVSPSDESTISRHITTYKYWMVDRSLSFEAWDRIGYSKLHLLASAGIGFDSQAFWLSRAFELSYADLDAELKDRTVTRTRRTTLSLSDAPSQLWEETRNRLREAIPEFNVPGIKLSDDKMVEFVTAVILQADAEQLRRLYDAATEMLRLNDEDERSKSGESDVPERILAALQESSESAAASVGYKPTN